MKNIKILLVVISFLAFIGSTNSQRTIYFTHGYGDDNIRPWRIYTPFINQLPGRPTTIPTPYISDLGVGSAVSQVNNQMNFSANSNSNNIAIGQSMGGIVLRESDRLNPRRRFGGLITLGSPNRGGAVINAMQNGQVESLFQEGCTEMSQAVGVSLFAFAVHMPYTSNIRLVVS